MLLPFVFLAFAYFGLVEAVIVPSLDQGFMFLPYDPTKEPVPIPVTEQCETLPITWSRSTATGPNPVAPYSLLVYTSYQQAYVIQVGDGQQLSFNWTVPFPPNTLYQICMFDKNGVTGGCQDIYTVIKNTTVMSSSCQNITAPLALAVQGTGLTGGVESNLSTYGWNDVCSDITVTPQSGSPPYTLTIAPSLHPPFNITSNNKDPITWTVTLGRAESFFMSLSSADGQLWSYGPLHAGASSNTACLAPGTIPASKAKRTAVAAGVGGLFGGAFLVALVWVVLLYLRKMRARYNYPIVEPMVNVERHQTTTTNGMQVYVVHHDGAPVPVEDARVVEFPPTYDGNAEAYSSSRGATFGSPDATSPSDSFPHISRKGSF